MDAASMRAARGRRWLMLSQVSELETFAWSTPPEKPKRPTKGMFIFPNCQTGALMGVEYPLKAKRQAAFLLKLAHAERDWTLPEYPLSESAAAEMLGISISVLQNWVKKGWIYYWNKWKVLGLETRSYPAEWDSTEYNKVMIPLPERIFSEIEVEALLLAKPRDL